MLNWARRGAASRLLTCACLLVVYTGLAATPLALLLTPANKCNCACRHENGKACCCRRAAHAPGPRFESAASCPGNCQCATQVPLRVGLFLPRPKSSIAGVLSVTSSAAVEAADIPPAFSPANILRERSPPLPGPASV